MSQAPGSGGKPDTYAWPFCVGSGPTTGQLVILAPPFLIATRRTYSLFEAAGSAVERAGSAEQAAGNQNTADGRWWRFQYSDEVGEFTAVFLVRRATPAMVGEDREELLDAKSRPVYFFAGVVLQDAADVSGATLEAAVTVATGELRKFWKANDKYAQIKPAAPIHAVATESQAASPPLTELPPATRPPQADPASTPISHLGPAPEPKPKELQSARRRPRGLAFPLGCMAAVLLVIVIVLAIAL